MNYRGGGAPENSSLRGKKAGFTLAEVLITIGIIGFVVAMTLPVLVSKYQKKVTVERLKSAYSILLSSLDLAKSDYGFSYDSWQGSEYKKGDFDFLYNTYFKPYIYTDDKKDGQICKNYKCKTEYKTLKGLAFYQHDWSGSFRLKNGIFVHIHPYHCGFGKDSDALYIDINGPEHGPNILGKDIFDFVLNIGKKVDNKNQGILTTPCDGMSRDELLERCSPDYDGALCASVGSVSCCSTLIMRDGWEIRNDYPW